jgi:hypothetical protein
MFITTVRFLRVNMPLYSGKTRNKRHGLMNGNSMQMSIRLHWPIHKLLWRMLKIA